MWADRDILPHLGVEDFSVCLTSPYLWSINWILRDPLRPCRTVRCPSRCPVTVCSLNHSLTGPQSVSAVGDFESHVHQSLWYPARKSVYDRLLLRVRHQKGYDPSRTIEGVGRHWLWAGWIDLLRLRSKRGSGNLSFQHHILC